MAGTNLNYWYYSEDGGYSWETDVLVSPQYGVWGGDPVIMTDTAGDFYFFSPFKSCCWQLDRPYRMPEI